MSCHVNPFLFCECALQLISTSNHVISYALISPIFCRWLILQSILGIKYNCLRPLYFSNMLLLTLLFDVWNILKWNVVFFLWVSCKVVLLTFISYWRSFLTKIFSGSKMLTFASWCSHNAIDEEVVPYLWQMLIEFFLIHLQLQLALTFEMGNSTTAIQLAFVLFQEVKKKITGS